MKPYLVNLPYRPVSQNMRAQLSTEFVKRKKLKGEEDKHGQWAGRANRSRPLTSWDRTPSREAA